MYGDISYEMWNIFCYEGNAENSFEQPPNLASSQMWRYILHCMLYISLYAKPPEIRLQLKP